MANWAEGYIKIRGKKENIKSFIENNIIHFLDPRATQEQYFEIEWEDDNYIRYSLKNAKEHEMSWLKGSKRHFIVGNEIHIYNSEKNECISTMYLKAAWEVSIDYISEISEIYDIDIKIYSFEKGMQFNQDIEARKGKIIKNKEIRFKDYEWECICPTLGG